MIKGMYTAVVYDCLCSGSAKIFFMIIQRFLSTSIDYGLQNKADSCGMSNSYNLCDIDVCFVVDCTENLLSLFGMTDRLKNLSKKYYIRPSDILKIILKLSLLLLLSIS